MKLRKSNTVGNSLQSLKALLKAKSISLPPVPQQREAPPVEKGLSPELEEKLFHDAMEGVTPISRENCVERIFQVRRGKTEPLKTSPKKEDAEALSELTELIRWGTGFEVLYTPEYVEGTGYQVHPEIAHRLHRGDFSIQAHIDLHGLTIQNAREVFERFLRWAVITGKRGVLVIHGRGLSSPAEPVLKAKVIECLTHGPWRKWVIAYCSARHCDGGAGATYVLLRQRPVTKSRKG
jgi:DNA-nicking Smr family endonuclease